MAMVSVDGDSLAADSQPKSVCFVRMNSRNDFYVMIPHHYY